MYQQVVKRGITVYDEWYVTRLTVTDEDDPEARQCYGVVAYEIQTGNVEGFVATKGVILATGGPGQVYDHTTNAVANTGDGQAMAYRAGVPLEDMEFVQFHPTTGVLISEGVRGEGGILYNAEGERFMFERGYANNAGELASRDVVSRAELTEVNEGRGIEDEYVHLDMRHLGEERITDRLENILHLARDFEGVDGLEDPMPVKPGQHYEMDGIEVDENGESCVSGLYAVGECACVSVHGLNRLGGNALPELIVFGARAGWHAAGRDLGTARIETGPDASIGAADLDTPVEPGEISPRSGSSDVAADGGTRADGGSSAQVMDATETVERAVEAEQARIEGLLEKEEGVKQATIRSRLQQAMTSNVNVFRNEEGLKQALRDIRECREAYEDVAVNDPSRTFNTDLIHTIETRNLLDLAEAITLGALARTEFRGAHWREQYQERKDDEWIKHTMLTWDDGTPELYYKPVVLKGEDKTYEPKERSY